MLSRVVFPAPFSPMRACTSPAATSKVAPSSAIVGPNRLPTSVMRRAIGYFKYSSIGGFRSSRDPASSRFFGVTSTTPVSTRFSTGKPRR